MQTLNQNKMFRVAVVLLIALAAVCGGYFAFAAKQKPLATYNPEQIQGDVKVVLLRVGKLTMFTDKCFSDSQFTQTIGEPVFLVNYLVEVPKKGAFAGLTLRGSQGLDIIRDGHSIIGQTEPGLIKAFNGDSQAFEKLSSRPDLRGRTIPDDKAALVEEDTLQGLNVSADQVDLHIKFGWNGKNMVFTFKDVPLN